VKLFEKLAPEERDKSIPELFGIVHEARDAMLKGGEIMKGCFQTMDNLQEIVQYNNRRINRVHQTAQDLQQDAKCHIALNDEDPKDANPQFSRKNLKKLAAVKTAVETKRVRHVTN